MAALAALALVPLLAPVAVAIAGAVACLILLYILDMWFRSWAYDEGHDDPGLIARVLRWGKARLTRYVRKLEKRIVSRLSNAVAARSDAVVGALNNATELVNRFGTTFNDLPAQTWRALHTLRHVTMPDYVTARLEPLWARVQAAHALALAASNVLTEQLVDLRATLRALPWGGTAITTAPWRAFLGSYRHLWEQVFVFVQGHLERIETELIPELRRDLDELARRFESAIGDRLDRLAERVAALETRVRDELGPLLDDLAGRVLELERQVTDAIFPRLDALQLAVDALAAEVFGEIGAGLVALAERIVRLERAVFDAIPLRFEELLAEIEAVRAEIAEGIRRGIGVFAARLEAVETALRDDVLPRLTSAEAAIDALAREIFGPPGAGLRDLIERVGALETQARENLLPRLAALEAALAPAALAALVLAALRTAAPQLFCRNVTNAAGRVCAQDEDLWDALLAGTLIFALALNPREVAAAAGALTGFLGSVIAETVDH